MIPIHNESGTIVGFGGRSLDGSDPKYLNSPESDVFNKSRLLYNLHRSKDAMRRKDRDTDATKRKISAVLFAEGASGNVRISLFASPFQRFELMREGGLGIAERRGGAAEGPELGDGENRLQLAPSEPVFDRLYRS